MTRLLIAGLIVLNVLLAAGVWMRMGNEKSAVAQIGAAPSDYAVVASTTNQKIYLYLLQVSSGRLAALELSENGHKIDVRPVRSVTNDLSRNRLR